PIEARQPTRSYRLKKFIRRNKVGVLTGAAVIAALIVGLVLASAGFLQASRQAEIARTEAVEATSAKEQAEVALVEKNVALLDKEKALKLAQDNDLLQRRRLYAAQMNFAQQALAENQPQRVLDLLESTRPRLGETDLRGFEWYYFWRQIHPGLRAICSNPEALGYK